MGASYTRGLDLSGTLEGAGGIGGLLARSRHATTSPYAVNGNSFYHADGNGKVTYLAGSSGGADAAYRYDPFGRLLAWSGSYATANVMRFSSKPWVAHNGSTTDGLYYYGYRFYDPFKYKYDPCDPIFAYSYAGGEIAQNALLTVAGLRAAAWLGGTRLGHGLNHNPYLRIGPGRMPRNGPHPPSTDAPRISVGPQRPGVQNPHPICASGLLTSFRT